MKHKVTIVDRHGHFVRLIGEYEDYREADKARRKVGSLVAGYSVRTEVVEAQHESPFVRRARSGLLVAKEV